VGIPVNKKCYTTIYFLEKKRKNEKKQLGETPGILPVIRYSKIIEPDAGLTSLF